MVTVTFPTYTGFDLGQSIPWSCGQQPEHVSHHCNCVSLVHPRVVLMPPFCIHSDYMSDSMWKTKAFTNMPKGNKKGTFLMLFRKCYWNLIFSIIFKFISRDLWDCLSVFTPAKSWSHWGLDNWLLIIHACHACWSPPFCIHGKSFLDRTVLSGYVESGPQHLDLV